MLDAGAGGMVCAGRREIFSRTGKTTEILSFFSSIPFREIFNHSPYFVTINVDKPQDFAAVTYACALSLERL
jgi:hypothetical protein